MVENDVMKDCEQWSSVSKDVMRPPHQKPTSLSWRHSKINLPLTKCDCAAFLRLTKLFAARLAQRQRGEDAERPSVRVVNPCRKARLAETT